MMPLSFSCPPLQVRFLRQPPEDIRKSNFFNFTIMLSLENEPVYVERARFERFLHENINDTRNGIMYDLKIKYSNGDDEKRKLYLILVDASSKEPIRYEGHDDSPKMQRVLLTHEVGCTRCSLRTSCGNKSEAPSDPRIVDRGTLQFFLKCNQNCLRRAGNPRDMRRFSLALSFEDCTYSKEKIKTVSTRMFVHNNSKHSRKKTKEKEREIKNEVVELEPEPPAYLDTPFVHPKIGIINESFSFYSQQWCKHGVTFRCTGLDLPVTSMVYCRAMSVYLPPTLLPGRVYITLFYNHCPVFSFPYDIQNRVYMDRMPPWTNGFLLLEKKDYQINQQIGHNINVAPILEEADHPSYNLPSHAYQAPPSFAYPPQVQQPYPYHSYQNYPQGLSPASSLSPNGSQPSVSNSPPMPYGPENFTP